MRVLLLGLILAALCLGCGGSASTSTTVVTKEAIVTLSWDAPADAATNPIVGYNIYRATGGSSYQLLNGSVNRSTEYEDTTTVIGQSYSYEVTSVNQYGVESVPSATWSANP